MPTSRRCLILFTMGTTFEINAASAVCRRCGTSYPKLKGYFPVSYCALYKGAGYMPYCKKCVDDMYASFLEECKDEKLATRQMCRKLDLYWSEELYDVTRVTSTARTMLTGYLIKLSIAKYAGKSYDDTLKEEDTLWTFGKQPEQAVEQIEEVIEEKETPMPSDDVVAFWGPGYSAEDYFELEQRKNYWLEHLPTGVEVTVGLEALLRQICSLEIDINRSRAAGVSVDKLQTTLNTLLGSAMLKPVQGNDSVDTQLEKTPFGVWIKKWENERPVPEPDPEMKDVDGLIKYLNIWFTGHLSKMLGLKNAHSKLYEDAIAQLRVDNPEFGDDEDDDDLLYDVFGGDDSDEFE